MYIEYMGKFGVIGTGSVGSAMIHALSRYHPYECYDLCEDYPFEPILDCDVVFICVPTDLGAEGHLDCSKVHDCIDTLVSSDYKGTIVIKSTLCFGFCDDILSEYAGVRIVYMPEFLRENNNFTWCASPDRVVIAGDDVDVDLVLRFFKWLDPDVPILRMTYKEAEFSKVAHNAFIATKVSFTNTVDMASSKAGMNPSKVMSVIWSDRRVLSSAHLRPGLGGFSGKCIPKDTMEMLSDIRDIGTDGSILEAAFHVNDLVRPSDMQSPPDVHVILPTSQQDMLYRRALKSIADQIRLPVKVHVVYDRDKGLTEGLESEVASISDRMCVELLCNHRSQNLAGAINTALESIPDDCFVAILDDDDRWDRRYLLNCAMFANDVGCDMVVSGLIRIDEDNPEGYRQKIPDSLSVHDFLIGNPGVQGSNLFVRAGLLKSIGGFSEELVSTTDRDVCIKLLSNDVHYDILYNHMVHHDCLSREDRLSTSGGRRKSEGLNSFYRKYVHMMDESEKKAFRERAFLLFGTIIDEG